VNRITDTPGVIIFPPGLFLGTLVLGLLIQWLRPLHLLPPLAARVIGFALLIMSWLLVHAAETAMKRAGTPVKPSQPTNAVVTDGPYRFSRNPMYVASIGLYLAISFLLNAAWPIVLLPVLVAVLDWGVIRREERYLAAKFGPSYGDYTRRVRRWI
jgi:protein-S-isoprenylcysteine O-methyltransferase Ste14